MGYSTLGTALRASAIIRIGGVDILNNVLQDIRGVHYAKRNGNRFVVVSYKNKECDIKYRKIFHLKKHGVRSAVRKATNIRKILEYQYGEPKHTPLYLDSNKKVEKEIVLKDSYFCLILKHNPTNKEYNLKFSMQDYDKIKNKYFYLDIDSDYPGSAVSTYLNGETVSIKNYIFSDIPKNKKLNHTNRESSDFRRNNIVFKDKQNYYKAPKNNESDTAIPGVYFVKRTRNEKVYKYWKASYWKEKKQKMFSCNKYGYEKAKQLAEDQRRKWEEKFE